MGFFLEGETSLDFEGLDGGVGVRARGSAFGGLLVRLLEVGGELRNVSARHLRDRVQEGAHNLMTANGSPSEELEGRSSAEIEASLLG